MSVFSNLTTEGLEQVQDRLGGFQAIPSDGYVATIKALYSQKASSSNALSVNLIADIDGREYRETFWVTNKAGENFFRNKQDNTKKIALPGFNHINDICLITTGKPLAEQVTEEKVMNVYDSEQQKEIPKSVPMITAALGEKIGLAILRETVFKQEKNTTTGEYEDTTETRTQNVTDKVYHPEFNVTIVEAQNNITTPDFLPKWLEKNKGNDRDRTKGKTGGEAPKSGKPSGNSSAPTSSLFGKK